MPIRLGSGFQMRGGCDPWPLAPEAEVAPWGAGSRERSQSMLPRPKARPRAFEFLLPFATNARMMGDDTTGVTHSRTGDPQPGVHRDFDPTPPPWGPPFESVRTPLSPLETALILRFQRYRQVDRR